MPQALIVHGGAGAIAPARPNIPRAGCAAAAAIGWQVLRGGGSALDAAIAATVALEDNPAFNAGTGATLTRDGVAELDAGLMIGDTLQVGAVAGVSRIKNPILLARQVLDSPIVLLAGAGAEEFAVSRGLALCDPQALITPEQRQRWQARRASDATPPLSDPDAPHGTVGAVALDAWGRIVAAASTGGMANKPPGRVGDTPIAGAGFYAEDGLGGVACTGQGEDFIRLAIARRTIEAIERGATAQQAAFKAISLLGTRIKGEGGLVVIDAAGRVGFARNTAAMAYAYITEGMTEPVASV